MQSGGSRCESGATTKNQGVRRQKPACEGRKVQQRWTLVQPKGEQQQEMPLQLRQVLRNARMVRKRVGKAGDETSRERTYALHRTCSFSHLSTQEAGSHLLKPPLSFFHRPLFLLPIDVDGCVSDARHAHRAISSSSPAIELGIPSARDNRTHVVFSRSANSHTRPVVGFCPLTRVDWMHEELALRGPIASRR